MTTITLPIVKNPTGPKLTDIEWATHSFNPLRAVHIETGKVGWACQKVSGGCRNCYAENINRVFGTGEPFSAEGMKRVRVLLDEQQMAAALRFRPKAGGKWEKPWSSGRAHVFIGDMTDIFGEWVTFETIDRLFALFALTPDVTWQVLTKRPERMAEYLNAGGVSGRISAAAWNLHIPSSRPDITAKFCVGNPMSGRMKDAIDGVLEKVDPDGARRAKHEARLRKHRRDSWPLPNVWLGASCEDQAAADARIPHLLRCPAAVRFLSCEPLLGPIELSRITELADGSGCLRAIERCGSEYRPVIQWVIVGGESGPGARGCNVEWVRSIVGQCKSAVVACFVKQLGKAPFAETCHPSMVNVAPNSRGWPVSGKGGDPAEWPEDLRVREMPYESKAKESA